MKLVNSKFEHRIIFKEGTYFLLIIEDSKCLRDYVSMLINQSNGESGDFVLSEKDKILSFKDNIIVVSDFFHFDDIVASFDTKLQAELKKVINDEKLLTYGIELIADITKYATKIALNFEYDLEFTEPTIISLLKYLKYHVTLDDSSLPNQLLDFLKTCNWLSGVSTFIFVNFSCFFSDEEIETIINECIAMKYNLLFIENSEITTYPLENKSKIIIDKDLCEIF